MSFLSFPLHFLHVSIWCTLLLFIETLILVNSSSSLESCGLFGILERRNNVRCWAHLCSIRSNVLPRIHLFYVPTRYPSNVLKTSNFFLIWTNKDFPLFTPPSPTNKHLPYLGTVNSHVSFFFPYLWFYVQVFLLFLSVIIKTV